MMAIPLERRRSFDEEDWNRPIMGSGARDTVLERRSLISNDDGILDGAVPDDFYEGVACRGKFFTRGCRGMIESIQLYCLGVPPDTITLRYSPHPGIGPFGEVTITPAAAWAWQDFVVEEMWNYDSLFIWVHETEADVDWAYDTELPYDGHISPCCAIETEGPCNAAGCFWDGTACYPGGVWEDWNARPFIRVVYTGETPGDVPVSGIINVIRIPSSGTEAASDTVANVASGVWTVICHTEGAGELIQVEVTFHTFVVPAAGVTYSVLIQSDGLGGKAFDNQQLTQSVVATFGRCSLGEFMQNGVNTQMWIRVPWHYRRFLRVSAHQTTGGPVNISANIVSNELV